MPKQAMTELDITWHMAQKHLVNVMQWNNPGRARVFVLQHLLEYRAGNRVWAYNHHAHTA